MTREYRGDDSASKCPSCDGYLTLIYKFKRGTNTKYILNWESNGELEQRSVGSVERCEWCGYSARR